MSGKQRRQESGASQEKKKKTGRQKVKVGKELANDFLCKS